MPEPELVNAVGGGDLEEEINLEVLSQELDGEVVRYNPINWPGLYFRQNMESPVILIFRTGKYNITGASSIDELFQTNDEFIEKLHNKGISVPTSSFELRNIVFLNQFDSELDLDKTCIALGLDKTEYEPEQFPGIMYHPAEVDGVFLIFRNGKVIFTGAKSHEHADEAYNNLFTMLNSMLT